MITLDHIHLKYKTTLIEDGHMDIPYGYITLICGESGSGKTTLLETIGLLTDITCSYRFDNNELKGINQIKKSQIMQNDIAFIFQDIYLFEHMSLKENILFYARIAHKEINDDMIYEYMNHLSLYLDINTDVKTMSIGERQRLTILCAMMKDAKLFIFDEPTAYLDNENKILVFEIIEYLSKTLHKIVLIASHDDFMIQRADRIYKIENQQLNLIKDNLYTIENKKQVEQIIPYINDYYHKIKSHTQSMINIMIAIVLGIVVGLFSFSLIYSYDYYYGSQDKLVIILNNEIRLVRKDDKTLETKDYNTVAYDLMNLNVYQYYQCDDMISIDNQIYDVTVIPYYSFENYDNNLYKDFGDGDCIVSYELYRETNCHEVILNDITYSVKGVISPSSTNINCIYIDNDTFNQIYDVSFMNFSYIIVQLRTMDDIEYVVENLSSDYEIVSDIDIFARVNMIKDFNPLYLVIFEVVIMLSYFIYNIYVLYDNKISMMLLKVCGYQNKRLCQLNFMDKWKTYIVMLLLSIFVANILIVIYDIADYILIINGLILIHILLFIIIEFMIYFIFLSYHTPVMLLRGGKRR
ncbi:MAG: ATP-binding cassette domain-containing protein [Erysipelotrichaceae bacterium]|nr:ATP-binding cassette domain-containing protein [Erysipelotrichaceae bacterium]